MDKHALCPNTRKYPFDSPQTRNVHDNMLLLSHQQPIWSKTRNPSPWLLEVRMLSSTHWPLRDVEIILFFKIIYQIDDVISAREIGLRWLAQNSIDDESTMFLVTAWCRQA